MKFYIILLAIGALVGLLFYCWRTMFLHKKRETIIKNFESYTAVLHYHMEKAYNMVHKDQILTYSIEATTLPDKEYHKASIDFLKLVEKLLGPTLTKEMVCIYGNYDTFIFNLAEYFTVKYDEDEIRKESMDDIMKQEVEPEEGA